MDLGLIGWIPIGPSDYFHPWWGGYGGRFKWNPMMRRFTMRLLRCADGNQTRRGAGAVHQLTIEPSIAELRTEENQNNQQANAQRFLSHSAGEHRSRDGPRNSPDCQQKKQVGIVVTHAQFKSAADEGNREAKAEVGSDNFGGTQRSHTEQEQRTEGSSTGGRKADFEPDEKRKIGQEMSAVASGGTRLRLKHAPKMENRRRGDNQSERNVDDSGPCGLLQPVKQKRTNGDSRYAAIKQKAKHSPRGVSPRGARRTVRDTLASYGSHQGTTAHSGPVREQMRGTAGYRPNPAPCTLDTIAQLLVFLSGPFDQFVVQLVDH